MSNVPEIMRNMRQLEKELLALSIDVENIQLSFDGRSLPNDPPKRPDTLTARSFLGALSDEQAHVFRLIGHLRGHLAALHKAIHPALASATEAAGFEIAAKFAPKAQTKTSPEFDKNGKHL